MPRTPTYVGLNSCQSFARSVVRRHILARLPEWRREFGQQLMQIEQDYVIVMLDDFLIQAPVDDDRLAHLVESAACLNLNHLRLVPLGRSSLVRAPRAGAAPAEISPGIQKVRERHRPIQPCRLRFTQERLLSMLDKPLSIWEFERQCIREASHCAIGDSPPIAYRSSGRERPLAALRPRCCVVRDLRQSR